MNTTTESASTITAELKLGYREFATFVRETVGVLERQRQHLHSKEGEIRNRTEQFSSQEADLLEISAKLTEEDSALRGEVDLLTQEVSDHQSKVTELSSSNTALQNEGLGR